MDRQLLVQLEDHPGALAAMCRVLATRGIDIRHVAAGAAGDKRWAALTADDADAAAAVLRSAGYPFVDGESFIVELPDRPGELAAAAERLHEAGVDLLGVLVVGHREGFAEVALAVDDLATARAVIGQA
jgi:hypothetical protein